MSDNIGSNRQRNRQQCRELSRGCPVECHRDIRKPLRVTHSLRRNGFWLMNAVFCCVHATCPVTGAGFSISLATLVSARSVSLSAREVRVR